MIGTRLRPGAPARPGMEVGLQREGELGQPRAGEVESDRRYNGWHRGRNLLGSLRYIRGACCALDAKSHSGVVPVMIVLTSG